MLSLFASNADEKVSNLRVVSNKSCLFLCPSDSQHMDLIPSSHPFRMPAEYELDNTLDINFYSNCLSFVLDVLTQFGDNGVIVALLSVRYFLLIMLYFHAVVFSLIFLSI